MSPVTFIRDNYVSFIPPNSQCDSSKRDKSLKDSGFVTIISNS